MKQYMRFLPILAAASLLAGCGDTSVSSRTTAPPPSPTPPETVLPAPLPEKNTPPPPATRKLVDPQVAQSFLSVQFKEINDKGYPVVDVTNNTDKDIDMLRGGFQLKDSEGNFLFASGYTSAVPGDVVVKAGETIQLVPYGLNRKEALMKQLTEEPEKLQFFFSAQSITYMDGTKESKLSD